MVVAVRSTRRVVSLLENSHFPPSHRRTSLLVGAIKADEIFQSRSTVASKISHATFENEAAKNGDILCRPLPPPRLFS